MKYVIIYIIFNYYNLFKMGSGISSEQIDAQERYVENKLYSAKKHFSTNCNKNYSDCQIKMKLRQEYNKSPYSIYNNKDDYILDNDWNRYKR